MLQALGAAAIFPVVHFTTKKCLEEGGIQTKAPNDKKNATGLKGVPINT